MFKDIPGFEGFYKINEFGDVYSLDRKITRSDGKTQTFKSTSIKAFINGSGYLQINLSKVGVFSSVYVHKAVYCAFNGYDRIPGKQELELNHIDHNKLNCHINNLEPVTHKENMQKMSRHYGIKRYGELVYRLKKSNNIDEIRKYDGTLSAKDIKSLHLIRCEECNMIMIKNPISTCRDCQFKLGILTRGGKVMRDLGGSNSELFNKDKVYAELCEYKNFSKVSKMYGLSDNGLRKWCVKFGIPSKTKYYRELGS